MYNVTLSREEYELLHEVLAARLNDIRHEIHHTDRREFRAELARREHVLDALIARLEQPEHAAL